MYLLMRDTYEISNSQMVLIARSTKKTLRLLSMVKAKARKVLCRLLPDF